jgi:hypothetical protein
MKRAQVKNLSEAPAAGADMDQLVIRPGGADGWLSARNPAFVEARRVVASVDPKTRSPG